MITNELKIAFVHISRTGGRSVSDFLARNLERQHKMNSAKTKLRGANQDLLAYHNLIDGHCGYQVVDLPRCFKYITILRNPVDRVISSYNRLMVSGDNEIKMDIAVRMREEQWSYLDYVTSANVEAQYWVNNATFLLSGIKAEAPNVDGRDLLATALSNLRYNFDFVGIFERMDDTIEVLKRKYGFTGDIPQIGVDEYEDSKYVPTAKELEITQRELFPDWIMYRVGEQLFKEQYHALA